ncbi:hypothetical protein [Acetivibrio cellulolyticus]|uniref:hypothetical protein n=1 Tax=Acetivibrio cellulolyticus TaxID=35830 RepID=UPI0001E2FAF2|nr:hypothetical protein [Acetivibrio cellulolyticus]
MSQISRVIKKIIEKLFKSQSLKRPKSEIASLGKKCNSTFEDIYTRCRIEFGRELVELMDIKRRLVEKCEPVGNCTPLQEMLVKKILQLMCLYFELADSLVSLKAADTADMTVIQHVDGTKDKMNRIYSLITSLNNQFYMKADETNFKESCDDLINEAEALSNVIDESITKDYREKYYE